LKSDNLLRTIKLFKMQGFETIEEFFLLGYLMAHGGEQYFLSHITHDMELIAKNADFWLPIVKDSHKIRVKICEEEIKNAKRLLLSLLRERNVKIPEWLERE